MTIKLSTTHANEFSADELQPMFSLIEKYGLHEDIEDMCAILSAPTDDEDFVLDIFRYDVSPVCPSMDGGEFRWEIVLCDESQVYIGLFFEGDHEASEAMDALGILCKILDLPYRIGDHE